MLTLLLIILTNSFLGLLIFTRNPRAIVNRLFLLVSLSTVAWMTASHMTDTAQIDQRLWWGRVAFAFPVIVTLGVALLSRNFPLKLKTSRRDLWLVCGIAVVGVVICMTNLVVEGVHIRIDGTDLRPGRLYFAFILVELLLVGYAVKNYLSGGHKFNDLQRTQAKLVVTGFVVSFLWVLATNVLLPLIAVSWGTVKFGPIGTVIFVAFTAYAIIRHRLFDMRLVVARSVAYVFSIGFLFVCYVIASSLLLGMLLGADRTDATVSAFNVLVLAVAVLLYQPQKRFFDKITNRLFYRDAYDPQVFLDQLNKTVISNIELSILLRHSAQVIESNLKCEYVLFSVFEGTYSGGVRYMGTAKKTPVKHEMTTLQSLKKPAKKIIDTDATEVDFPELHGILAKNNIAIFAQLATLLDMEHEATAYMLLGPKKSGNQYSQQDLQIIEIVADELVVAIQNALRFEEIQNFNITLQEKVDDATKKLRKTNEKLKEMDETKDDFISMASHQLRTPLTSVKGYLSMVLEGDAGKVTPMQQKMLEQAFVSSQRMTYLISDLLNVSRLKTGKFVIERAPTNLVAVVQQELAQLTEAAKGRNLTLVFDPPKDFPALMLDETKTRQLIMNFVDNAIYYTPPGGTIEIRMTQTAQSVEFTVTDTGLGVPKHDQPHLFTKFYRAQNARKARPDGTGLGLFMAKKVVVAQGGAIIFKSQEGKGSTFGFTFPKTKELTEVN